MRKKVFVYVISLTLLLSACTASNTKTITSGMPDTISSISAEITAKEPAFETYTDKNVSFQYDKNLFSVDASDESLIIINCLAIPEEPAGSHNTLMGIVTETNDDYKDFSKDESKMVSEYLAKEVCQGFFTLNDGESIIKESTNYSNLCAEYVMEISDGSICYTKTLNYNSEITMVILRLCEYSKEYNNSFMDIYKSAISELGNYDFGDLMTTADADNSDTKIPVETPDVTTAVADNIPTEYKSALNKAYSYSDIMHMSKAGIYDQLTSEYGEKFSAEAAQYAIDNMEADWNANALAKAKEYSDTMHMSKLGVYDQLISEYGEKFTPEEAQYAIDNVVADWNANALEKAKSYQEMDMSPSAIHDQLTSEYGERFTKEEADYAIENLN